VNERHIDSRGDAASYGKSHPMGFDKERPLESRSGDHGDDVARVKAHVFQASPQSAPRIDDSDANAVLKPGVHQRHRLLRMRMIIIIKARYCIAVVVSSEGQTDRHARPHLAPGAVRRRAEGAALGYAPP
jgi:hypothetical protein